MKLWSESFADGGRIGGDVRRALAGHVLASASLTGTCTLNPRLAGQGG